MKRLHTSIAELLHMAQLAISNGRANEEIRAVISKHGYDEEGLRAGEELYQAARQAVETRKNAASAQRDATARMKAARQEAKDAFQRLAQVARAVLGEPGLAALALRRNMPRSTAAFLDAGHTLFNNARDAQVLAQLERFGYDHNELDNGYAKIKALDAADLAQEMAKGVAQNATQEQDDALRALNDWLRCYIRVTRAVLRGKEHLLEALGVRAYRRKRRPKAESSELSDPV